MKSCESETLAERITRLLGPHLRNPERTREILERLSNASRSTPQPSNCETTLGGHSTQMQLFERAPLKCEAATLARSPLVDPEPKSQLSYPSQLETFYAQSKKPGRREPATTFDV
jgi:hypothetical protein